MRSQLEEKKAQEVTYQRLKLYWINKSLKGLYDLALP